MPPVLKVTFVNVPVYAESEPEGAKKAAGSGEGDDDAAPDSHESDSEGGGSESDESEGTSRNMQDKTVKL